MKSMIKSVKLIGMKYKTLIGLTSRAFKTLLTKLSIQLIGNLLKIKHKLLMSTKSLTGVTLNKKLTMQPDKLTLLTGTD